MATTLTEIATEGSTYVVTCSFSNEEGEAIIPASIILWRLLNKRGSQISSGTATAGASVDIVLSGTDLAISDVSSRETHWVILVVSTTYNSSLGSGLPLVDTVKFQVRNLLDTP